MATHRHHRAGIVLATATALVVGGSLPASAATNPRHVGGISAHTLQVSQHRIEARRAAQAAAAAHRRTTSRLAAVHAATTAQTRVALPATTPTALPTKDITAVTAPVAPVVVPVSAPVVAPVVSPVLTRSPSGEAAPVGDLPGWTQTYVEDFTTDVATGAWPGSYSKHWSAYDDGWKDTSKNGTYMPSKVLSVHDGVLDYSVRTEAGKHLVSAPVVKDTVGQVYGRYSVRFRSDSLPGYKSAWLLWPDSEQWPSGGEIDFPEGGLDSTIDGFAHFANSNGGQDAFSTKASFQDWHTATIEWIPGKVSFILDGKVLGSSTQDVPTTAMHWVLQTETALQSAAPADSVAGHVLIDWVALYKRS